MAYIRTIKATRKPFQLVDALLQVIVSGFAGMLTMLLCWYITAPLPLCGFMAGMAGLMLDSSFSVNIGDALCFAAMLFVTAHIMLVQKYVNGADPCGLACWQALGGLVLAAAFAFAFETLAAQ